MKDFIKSRWRLLLVVASFAVVAIVFFNILRGDPSLANAIVAFGTLTLALVTALHIMNSNEQEKRRRKEGLLNEIIEWAIDVASCAFSIPAPMVFEDIIAGLETASIEELAQRASVTTYTNLRLKYQIHARKSKYMENIASSFSGNLGDDVKKLNKQINNVISVLSKAENFKRAEDSLRKQADILVEEAVKIKDKDIS